MFLQDGSKTVLTLLMLRLPTQVNVRYILLNTLQSLQHALQQWSTAVFCSNQ
jgi:hypothetical protein